MKKSILVVAVAGLLSAGVAFADGFGGSVGVVSDYVFRGVSLSDNHAGVQATGEYKAGGLLVGVAANSTDSSSGDGVELMALASYTFPITKTLSGEVGVTHYNYPGVSGTNTTEVSAAGNLNLGKIGAQLKTSYSNDYFGKNSAWYTEANVGYALPYSMTLVGHIGRVDGTVDVVDYKIGVTKQFGKRVIAELAWTDTDVNTNLTDSRVTVGARMVF